MTVQAQETKMRYPDGTPYIFENVRTFVEQHVEALARGQLALGVLGVDAALAAAEPCRLPAGFELFENCVHGVRPLCAGIDPA